MLAAEGLHKHDSSKLQDRLGHAGLEAYFYGHCVIAICRGRETLSAPDLEQMHSCSAWSECIG